MAKPKLQKEKDLQELTDKLKGAKAVVLTAYRGTTVKDMDRFRSSLRKEKVFSKVYKIPLIKKAMEANGIAAATVDYKQPVILSISEDEESTPARIIQNLAKDIKTLSILEGILGKEIMSKAQVEALGSLPSKDQLRAQFMSVLNGPMAAFARAINALAEKMAQGTPADPVAEAVAPAQAEAPAAPADALPAAA